MLSIHFRTMIGGMSGNDLVTIRRFTVTPCWLFVPVRAVSGANYRQSGFPAVARCNFSEYTLQ